MYVHVAIPLAIHCHSYCEEILLLTPSLNLDGIMLLPDLTFTLIFSAYLSLFIAYGTCSVTTSTVPLLALVK